MVVSLFALVLFVGLILGLPSTQIAYRRWRQRRATTITAFLMGPTGPMERLDALSDLVKYDRRGRRFERRDGVTYLMPAQPVRELTDGERDELVRLRDCSFTWEELEKYASLWGLDPRAVAAEHSRVEAALALPPPTEET
jgi:hypothetical protein